MSKKSLSLDLSSPVFGTVILIEEKNSLYRILILITGMFIKERQSF
jgi:hypothetical protein